MENFKLINQPGSQKVLQTTSLERWKDLFFLKPQMRGEIRRRIPTNKGGVYEIRQHLDNLQRQCPSEYGYTVQE